MINNNPDLSGQPIAAPVGQGIGGFGGGAGGGAGGFGLSGGGGGFGAGGFGGNGRGGAPALDPNTGLPIADNTAAATAEPVDVGSWLVKIPGLTDVRLADVLDAIKLVTQNPNPADGHSLKYSITDFAIVFSAEGQQTPQLFMRTFRIDPNTFYSGLESVSSQPFASVNNNSSGGGTSGGGGGRQQWQQ